MKRQLLFASSIIISAAAMAQTFSGGSGTESDPWLISNVNDLKELSKMTDTPGEGNTQQTYGKYFKLTQDITEPFNQMIGFEGYFKGYFDGAGHCITLNINMPDDDCVGLFGTVKTGAVHDLAVKGSVTGRRYVGAVVANPTNEAQLYNLVNYANVSSSYTSMAYIGGVIGGVVSQTEKVDEGSEKTLDGATIRNCANYGTVSCNGSAIGGVIGYSGQAVGNTVNDIANYGYVENNGGMRVGGAIGNPLWNDKIHRIANFGTSSNEKISGSIGNSNPTDLGEIFYDRQYSHTTNEIPAQEKNTSEMTGTQMEELLGSNWVYADGLLPRPDMNGMENSDIAVLYATPILLAEGDYLQNVTKDFSVSFGNPAYGNVSWTTKNGIVEIQGDGKAVIKGYGEETLTAKLNGETRSINITVNDPTGISSITTRNSADGKWYNLNGQAVSTPVHGIFIVNGKKVILK